MLNLWKGRTALQVAIGLTSCWMLCPLDLAAQEAPGVLVVVTNPSDADQVKRIGRNHVHVELLFAQETGAVASNYTACDKRIRGLLGFRLLVFRDDASPGESFWRARMVGANPRGKVHRLAQSRHSVANESEHWIQRAIDIHAALASIVPEHQATLDENLQSEIRHFRSLRLYSPRLVFLERNPDWPLRP